MHIITQIDRMERMSDYLRGEAVRSLDLLRQIDGTIEALVLIRRQMDGFNELVGSLIKQVHAQASGTYTEDELIPSLEQSQDVLKRLHADFEMRHKCAKDAPELKSEDGVEDAYGEVIESLLRYSDSLERLKWSVLEHNADMEGHQEPHLLTTDKDIDDLFDNL
ncbi:hypothetical protein [Pseudomonas syringae group sp. J248-6]|uniref:hypothetical protein n=1 Tax=Pseudomonas syringae group sp. J248-6 TaxID=3079590 RepID=UPI0029118AF1|nr:hypothetical protein [Pseudomonas syringae group sp. J248-6]MDU8542933.1 hypothetical protein [Pseudomonas syringae group sp. J248-6]